MWIFAFLLLSCPIVSFAQMSLPSVFPAMKSINPAVISLRKSGIVKLSLSQDTIERKQGIVELNGTSFQADQKDDIKLNSINLFKGGKAGGTTSEWLLDLTTGNQKTEFVQSTGVLQTEIDAKAIYGKYALGFQSRWGLEFHFLNYTTDYTMKALENGSEKETDVKIDIKMPGVRIGKIFGSPSFSVGMIGEINLVQNKLTSSDPDMKGDDKVKPMPVAGIAFGTGGANGLLEAGVEVDFSPQDKEPDSDEKPSAPMKASLVAETKIKGIILGYKGMYFKGPFMDFDRVVPIQMVYKSAGDEARLENQFNFMLKPEKGFSIGASVSMSNTKTKEKSSVIMSENKHDTSTKSFGVGATIGYVW